MNLEASGEPLDPSIINKARNDLIFNSQGPAIVVVCLVVIGFAVSIVDYVSTTALIIWTVLCISSYLARYFLCRFYIRSAEDKQGAPGWQLKFSYASLASGMLWGAATFIIFPEESQSHQLTLLLILIILSAATTVTHSAYRWASMGFSVSCLLPASIKLFMFSQGDHVVLASIVFGFLLVMASSSLYLEKIANRMFILSYQNAKLVSDLTHKNSELEVNYRKLEETKHELSVANDSLQKLATTDALTGLTNRRKFEALTKLKWMRCVESKQALSVIIVNIDHFKQFNDFYGHRKGDSCLLSIGSFLSQLPEIHRQGDCVARYTGDEFAILLFDADLSYTKQVADRIRKGVELLRIPCSEMPSKSSPWITVSIGVANETGFTENSFEDLFDMADKAMYTAKRAGRNCVHVYSEEGSSSSIAS